MSNMAKLEVKNLTISFRTNNGAVRAVRDISFNLNEGETLAIAGESGSCKSVTTRAVMGILAGPTPGAVRSGMEAALSALERLGFEEARGVPYLAHTVASAGIFLSEEAGVPLGSALAYLIAPPLESMYALDAALKAADVKLCKLYSPPSQTNFGGGLLTGSQSACAAACTAFAQAVAEVARKPK